MLFNFNGHRYMQSCITGIYVVMLIQPKWIHLLRNPQESFYYTKMKQETKIYRVS